MKNKRRCRWLRAEKGQALVESALVIPLIIVILCGIIDFGWIFFNQLMVTNCSREGARYAAVNSESTSLTTIVATRVRAVSGISDPQNLVVVVNVASGDVSVQVSKVVPVLTPIAGVFVKDQQINLHSTTVMRIG